jgi:plastocyanin
MKSMHRRRLRSLGLLAMLFPACNWAGVVTVEVTTTSGIKAEDTVIVFDPLDATPQPSHDKAIIDQVNKQYVPRVSVVRTGTEITFPNSDRIRHQVYSFSKPNKFNLKLYAGSPPTPVTFDKPGLVVLGCNIHDHMVAFVGVVDTPYFAKTPASGTAALNLPAGRYRMRVWHPHEIDAAPPREVDISAAPMTIPVQIDVQGASTSVAAWPE